MFFLRYRFIYYSFLRTGCIFFVCFFFGKEENIFRDLSRCRLGSTRLNAHLNHKAVILNGDFSRIGYYTEHKELPELVDVAQIIFSGRYHLGFNVMNNVVQMLTMALLSL